jgi:lipid-binding SYLF domain-containing protein
MKSLFALFLASLAMLAAPDVATAATADEINASANDTLHRFVEQNPSAQELGRKAAGALVFPSIIKAGFGFGGAYGEGVLIVHGNAAGYYNIVSASFGFQMGVQSQALIVLFMTEDALNQFEQSYGWKVGVDGSIVVVTLGASGSIDTNNLTSPILGFVTDETGLMYSLSLEGSKITRFTP